MTEIENISTFFTSYVRRRREGNVFSLFVYSQGVTPWYLVPGPSWGYPVSCTAQIGRGSPPREQERGSPPIG